VAFSGNVLFTSEEGDTFVVRAGARAELLATNSLGEAMFASPALSQGRIFLRGVRHLYCLRVSGA
jgi:outer membrane protein assembly factor BamB